MVVRSPASSCSIRPDDAHLEELVEVLAEDGEELRPLEQRERRSSSASARTRALKSSQESSRLRKRSPTRRSDLGFGPHADSDVDAGHARNAGVQARPPVVTCRYSRDRGRCRPFGRTGAEEVHGYRPSVDMSTDPRFAEPTPFARLVYAQAVGVCGDACIIVSMAGSHLLLEPDQRRAGQGAAVPPDHDDAVRASSLRCSAPRSTA